jgi:hypothetical protein
MSTFFRFKPRQSAYVLSFRVDAIIGLDASQHLVMMGFLEGKATKLTPRSIKLESYPTKEEKEPPYNELHLEFRPGTPSFAVVVCTFGVAILEIFHPKCERRLTDTGCDGEMLRVSALFHPKEKKISSPLMKSGCCEIVLSKKITFKAYLV